MSLPIHESLDEAFRCVDDGLVEAWIMEYLRGEGDEPKLADGLLLRRRYYLGPVLFPLAEVYRCCGPEPSMQFMLASERWESELVAMRGALADGWKPAPLIADGTTRILYDGSHRHAALGAAGFGHHAVIFVFDDPVERVAFVPRVRVNREGS